MAGYVARTYEATLSPVAVRVFGRWEDTGNREPPLSPGVVKDTNLFSLGLRGADLETCDDGRVRNTENLLYHRQSEFVSFDKPSDAPDNQT